MYDGVDEFIAWALILIIFVLFGAYFVYLQEQKLPLQKADWICSKSEKLGCIEWRHK